MVILANQRRSVVAHAVFATRAAFVFGAVKQQLRRTGRWPWVELGLAFKSPKWHEARPAFCVLLQLEARRAALKWCRQ
jgi:hypothetical protein